MHKTIASPRLSIETLLVDVEEKARTIRSKDLFSSGAEAVLHATNYFQAKAQERGLAAHKAEEVLRSVSRLLTATQNRVRYEDRVVFACQILAQAGRPESITSRGFSTSAAGALEHVLYRDFPEILVEMLVDTLLKGECYSPSGRTVRIERENRLPIYSADMSVLPSGEKRSYASQVAQTILTNDILKNQDSSLSYALANVNEEAELTGMNSGDVFYGAGRGTDRVAELVFENDVCLGALEQIPVECVTRQANAFGVSMIETGTVAALYEVIAEQSEGMMVPLTVGTTTSYALVLGATLHTGMVELWSAATGIQKLTISELHAGITAPVSMFQIV